MEIKFDEAILFWREIVEDLMLGSPNSDLVFIICPFVWPLEPTDSLDRASTRDTLVVGVKVSLEPSPSADFAESPGS